MWRKSQFGKRLICTASSKEPSERLRACGQRGYYGGYKRKNDNQQEWCQSEYEHKKGPKHKHTVLIEGGDFFYQRFVKPRGKQKSSSIIKGPRRHRRQIKLAQRVRPATDDWYKCCTPLITSWRTNVTPDLWCSGSSV